MYTQWELAHHIEAVENVCKNFCSYILTFKPLNYSIFGRCKCIERLNVEQNLVFSTINRTTLFVLFPMRTGEDRTGRHWDLSFSRG